MKYFIFASLLGLSALARQTDNQVLVKAEGAKIKVTPKQGYHLNAEAPATATFDNLEGYLADSFIIITHFKIHPLQLWPDVFLQVHPQFNLILGFQHFSTTTDVLLSTERWFKLVHNHTTAI